jgi:DNA-directed RNA polymerase II subunit RPB4
MSHHAPTSRPKPPPPGEEEASSVLKLGEFQDVDTLTLSEASLVINALLAKRKKDRKDRNETEILNKTLDYLDAFARIKGKENVEAAERLLSARKELTKFERAQIGRSNQIPVGFGVEGRGVPWLEGRAAGEV